MQQYDKKRKPNTSQMNKIGKTIMKVETKEKPKMLVKNDSPGVN